ncbi:Ca2+-binding RTX toxin-like protein [Nocardioides cavernae]|uniref:Ca2+-binding RTX toxin-like protein n=1 Tax=Nocardioides cavernae TaxID=1921566 RepID=A0A7Y9H1L2_9ACTN|nr:calcium-binding protein [Nocardioides cavernae]NYE36263.1 Ca2+-binding RTX toxin-like protein [Nocardioides cavernae]
MIGLAVTALGPVAAAAPARAAETCDGKAATLVVSLPAGSWTSAPVTGTPGDDVIVGTTGNDTIDGAGGNDTICGLGGADTLVGGDGDDRLFGGADADYAPDDGYYGDLLVPGAGDDLVDLGTGATDIWFWESPLQVDQVSYADAPAGVRVDLAAGTATGHGTDTIVAADPGRPIGVIGSSHDDTLLGSAARDVIDAGGGDDVVDSGDGADVVRPDNPGRTTSGWSIDAPRPEPVPQPGDDVVSTGPGSDGVTVERGVDVVRGGADVDRLSSDSPDPGTRLLGGDGNDRLFTEVAGTVMRGQSGDDTLTGHLAGRRSTWDGGSGRDRLIAYTPQRPTGGVLRVDVPRKRITAGRTTLGRLVGVERISAFVRFPRAEFRGGPANEWFSTSARSVRAWGGAGADRLDGTTGSDLLDGGPGRDRLTGYAGRDRCVRGEVLKSCEVRR